MAFKDIKKKPTILTGGDPYANIAKYSTKDTIDACKEGLRLLKIDGRVIGVASSEEDEKKAMELLHRYGYQIDTVEQAMDAGMNMITEIETAQDMIEAEIEPSNEYVIDGKKVYEIDGNLYDRDGNQINN